MVRALLDGRKTQTRRIVKPQPEVNEDWLRKNGLWEECRTETSYLDGAYQAGFIDARCPYGEIGDRLWVKESIERDGADNEFSSFVADGAPTKADAWPWKRPKLPSLFMPWGLRRITLEIIDVRVQRLQDISEADAQAEGVQPYKHIGAEQRVPGPGFGGVLLMEQPHRLPFADLWDSINGEDAWDANPWVWALTFKRVLHEI